MFISGPALLWSIIAISWALIILTIFYMVFSYVIKTPTYLETEEAVKIYNDEIEEKRIEKERSQLKNNNTSFRLQEKLKKLKDLKDQNLITEEEYTNKKSELLNTF